MSTELKRIATPRIAMYHATGRYESRLAVRQAVLSGELPNPSTLKCVDCGQAASEYEHRDYAKPLDVAPVCGSCNMKRGRGTDHPETDARLSQYRIEDESGWREYTPPPSLAPMHLVVGCRTYTEAVRLCWDLRRYKTMTMTAVSERIGTHPAHMSEMLAPEEAPRKRDLPAKRINDFEWVVGNRAITQWHLTHSGILLDLPLMQALVQALEQA